LRAYFNPNPKDAETVTDGARRLLAVASDDIIWPQLLRTVLPGYYASTSREPNIYDKEYKPLILRDLQKTRVYKVSREPTSNFWHTNDSQSYFADVDVGLYLEEAK